MFLVRYFLVLLSPTNSAANELTPERIGAAFGPLLLRRRYVGLRRDKFHEATNETPTSAAVVTSLLQHYDKVFIESNEELIARLEADIERLQQIVELQKQELIDVKADLKEQRRALAACVASPPPRSPCSALA